MAADLAELTQCWGEEATRQNFRPVHVRCSDPKSSFSRSNSATSLASCCPSSVAVDWGVSSKAACWYPRVSSSCPKRVSFRDSHRRRTTPGNLIRGPGPGCGSVLRSAWHAMSKVAVGLYIHTIRSPGASRGCQSASAPLISQVKLPSFVTYGYCRRTVYYGLLVVHLSAGAGDEKPIRRNRQDRLCCQRKCRGRGNRASGERVSLQGCVSECVRTFWFVH